MPSKIVEAEADEAQQLEASLMADSGGVPDGIDDGSTSSDPASADDSGDAGGEWAPQERPEPGASEAGTRPVQQHPEPTPPPYVPIMALQLERERANKAEQDLRAAQQAAVEAAILKERLRAYSEQAERRKAEEASRQAEAEIPNPISDPEGYRMWADEKRHQLTLQQLEELRRENEMTRATQAHLQMENVVNSAIATTREMEAAFQAQNPDYWDAYQILERGKLAELMVVYGTEQAARAELEKLKDQLVGYSFQLDPNTGRYRPTRNPAAVIYEMAKAYGFRPGAARAQRGAPARQRVEAASARARAASASLSVPHGASPAAGGGLSVERLATMSEAEFAALAASNPRIVDALMGRE